MFDADGYCNTCGRENYRHYDACEHFVSFEAESRALGVWHFGNDNGNGSNGND